MELSQPMPERLKYCLAFGLLGAIFFIPFLGGVHLFDWDEINFAEISREMILLKDYLRVHVNFQPFFEKPPLFFWMQVLAMNVFGIGEFAARLPNAICGIATLMILYDLGRRLHSHRFGIIWAGVYFGSILPFLYFKSGIIDPWFNLFIFLGLYFFIRFYWAYRGDSGLESRAEKSTLLVLSGLFVGLGILTKGPVAFLIAGLTMIVYWVFKRFKWYVKPLHFVWFAIASSVVMLTWYGLETLQNGAGFAYEFNKYQIRLFSTPDAGHKGFPGYHFVVLLLGVFPASVFAVRSFFRMPGAHSFYQNDFRLWMKILFWVVLILFTIVKSKIVHYSSMCYFPMTYLGAIVLDKIWKGEVKMNGRMTFGVWSIGGIIAMATIGLPFAGRQIELLKPLFHKDPFALANLEAEVYWSWADSLPGIVLLIALILAQLFLRRKKLANAFVALFLGTAIFVMTGLVFLINKIESYSQRAAIEFFESKKGTDCYIITHGYKSYAQLFYFNKPPVQNPKSFDKQWLMDGAIDKPVYIVSKVTRADELTANPNLKEIGRKNGFVFFERKIPVTQ